MEKQPRGASPHYYQSFHSVCPTITSAHSTADRNTGKLSVTPSLPASHCVFKRLLLFLPLLSWSVSDYPVLIGLTGSHWWPSLAASPACWVMIIKLKYPGTYQCISRLSTPRTHSSLRGYTGETGTLHQDRGHPLRMRGRQRDERAE